jgi:hypothetical protein
MSDLIVPVLQICHKFNSKVNPDFSLIFYSIQDCVETFDEVQT